MQFSIFGVPFKCTKDIFTWEKIKWSIFVYWTQLWRGLLLAASGVFLLVGTFFLPTLMNPNELEVLSQGADPSIRFLAPIVYAYQYWYQQMFVPGIVLACLLFLGLILVSFYIQYYGFFKKNYRSFARQFNKPVVVSFWTGGFWKPAIFTMVFGLLTGFIPGTLFRWLDIQQGIIVLINLLVGAALFHIFLHGGTWGFVPAAKQTK